MKFEPVAWSDHVADSIAVAAGSREDLRAIQREVEASISQVWKCDNGSFLVTRVELSEFGRELVFVCYEGNSILDAARQLIPAAFAQGFHSVRIHTVRPGVVRILREFDPEPLEYTVRIFNHDTRSGTGVTTEAARGRTSQACAE